MKTFSFQKSFLAVAAIGLALSTMTVVAQNSPDTTAPPLAYGVPQILKLAQAGVSDDTIAAYIRNSGNSYGLDADQIIYLRQQGISDHVLTAMLNQPKAAPAPPAMPPGYPYAAQTPVAYAQPAPAYVQPAPSPTVYVVPNNQTYYYNSYYAQPYFFPSFFIPFQPFRGCFVRPCPFVSASFRFGGHFNNNAGFHGAVVFHNGGGFHGAVGFHGGGMMMHR